MLFERQPKSLRAYMRKARLPPMQIGHYMPDAPPDGHKSHVHLAVRREQFRKLEIIRHIKAEFMEKRTLEFCKANVAIKPCQTGHEGEGVTDKLTIPVNGFKIPASITLNPATDISRIGAWLDTYPLATIQSIMHQQYPRTSEWKIIHDSVNPDDSDLLRSFSWFCPCAEKCGEDHQHGQTSLTVIYQPPWILTSADLKSFCDTDSLPSFEKKTNKMHSKHRLWARIWDLCWTKQSPYFVLSTYDEWVLGMFSDGWTAAFVSKPLGKREDSAILQSLLYWFSSSMHQPGTWIPHNIPEVAPKLEPRTRAAVMALRHDNDPMVPSWMKDSAPTIVSRRTSISTAPGSSRRRRVAPSSPSSASSVCDGHPTQNIIRSTLRSIRVLSKHNINAQPELPILPPRRSPSPVVDLKVRYSPYQMRRPRPKIVNLPCSSDIPDIFRAAAMARPFEPTVKAERPAVIVEEPEELPRAPSTKGKNVAQSSVIPGSALDPDRRLSAWLAHIAASDHLTVEVAPKSAIRDVSPALSTTSSAGTTVVDMIPHPEPDSHPWAGGWIVRGPKNYRPCP